MSDQDDLRTKLLERLARRSVFRGSFTLASGAESDLYIDAKLTTLDPSAALLVGKVGWKTLREIASRKNLRIAAIGGLTMGADPIALSIGMAACDEDPDYGLQTFSVRKSPKGYGRQKYLEGNFAPGDPVVIIDDVITTGGSTLQAIERVEAEGGHIAFVLALVDREEGGLEAIQTRGYQVVPILTRRELLAAHEASVRETH